jgi:hypothetical protein
MKILKLALVSIILIALGWFMHQYLWPEITTGGLGAFFSSNKTNVPADTVPTESEGVLCAEVITPARDPKTGVIKEFPRPCDVPDGWEIIQNDVPSLDLEVQ